MGPHLGASRAELAFMAEHDPEVEAVWNDLLDRGVPTPTPGPHGIVLLLARMAADGPWTLHAISNTRLPPAVRDALVARLKELTERPDDNSWSCTAEVPPRGTDGESRSSGRNGVPSTTRGRQAGWLRERVSKVWRGPSRSGRGRRPGRG
ncbi:hypothetical protein ACFT8P_13440 [Streptomyces sp. NPDC057101]|uniref:hypothetical protein n=1 Tax=Streptomyces sp. NPDC057101 TaxID=3346020 RepID=UPI003631B0EC